MNTLQTLTKSKVCATLIDRALGCMVGAAAGDSLGAAPEFMTMATIRRQFGPDGIQELAGAFGFPPGVITDDTQQAMAVAEGLARASRRGMTDDQIRTQVWHELKAWHATQSDPRQNRAPGGTSMGSLSGDMPGSIQSRVNASSSCGSVMRAHPIGIAYTGDPEEAFRVGMQVSALTHGGDQSLAAAGALGSLIAILMDGRSLQDAISSMRENVFHPNQLTLPAALQAIVCSTEPQVNIADIGQGWDADSALAIGLYCALRHENDYVSGVRLAVNHDGDSDSTGSIAGAILGALNGFSAVPRRWRERIERRGELAQHARSLLAIAERRMK
jgi:ADP-ribosylglycohydrolase